MPEKILPFIDSDHRAIPHGYLTAETDGQWLTQYGLDPLGVDYTALNELVSIGSLDLKDVVIHTANNRTQIVAAREQFFTTIGLSPETKTMKLFREEHPAITPLLTFIDTQRLMAREGLHGRKIINTFPRAIGLSSEGVLEKVENLRALGLDPVKVINAKPVAISLSSENVGEKVENLRALGLDPVKIINTQPQVLGFSAKSIQDKVKRIRRYAALLHWRGSVEELIEKYPMIFSSNRQKLQLLARIAASDLSPERREATISQVVANGFINPAENWIAAYGERSVGSDLDIMNRTMRLNEQNRGNKSARQEQAEEAISNNLVPERVVYQYRRYKGQDKEQVTA